MTSMGVSLLLGVDETNGHSCGDYIHRIFAIKKKNYLLMDFLFINVLSFRKWSIVMKSKHFLYSIFFFSIVTLK